MTVNSYLQGRANNLVIRETEKEKILKSVDTIKSRLSSYFSSDLSDALLFGSYTRGTILPRSVDSHSDIDIMAVFKNDYGYKPQTFLDKLKRFAEYRYPNSIVAQSSPSIVLKLEHITFEITPAYKSWYGCYIPASRSEWQATDPNGFNNILVECNKNNQYKIKPVVRLMKLWNLSLNGRDMASFKLEKKIAEEMQYAYISCSSYTDYLKKAFSTIKWNTDWKKVDDAVRHLDNALKYEANDMPYCALSEIKEIFPE